MSTQFIYRLRSSLRCVLGVGLILFSCTAYGDALQVVYQPQSDGSYQFTLKGLSIAPSALILKDIQTGKEVCRLSEFQASTDEGYSTSWSPGEVAAVCSCVVINSTGLEDEIPINSAGLNTVTRKSDMIKLDRRHGLVHWRPEQTSLTKITAGLGDGLYIKTLAEWTFNAPKNHEITWDMHDGDGVKNYRHAMGLMVYKKEIPLPSNLVVVGTPSYNQYQDVDLFQDFVLDAHPINFTISSPKASRDEAIFELRKTDGLVIQLEPESKAGLALDRFEILFFVDGSFVMEEPEASDPYQLSVEPFLKGKESVLTVNILSYSGGSGTRSVRLKNINDEVIR